jgi:predicted RNA-binding Zn-ribbon protein involved in translation (DUF1610 family)
MFTAVRPTCPVCGGSRVHHSRPRSILERGRRLLTWKVPYRCHACGWRGWMNHTSAEASEGLRSVHRDLTDAEFERLEAGVEGEQQ